MDGSKNEGVNESKYGEDTSINFFVPWFSPLRADGESPNAANVLQRELQEVFPYQWKGPYSCFRSPFCFFGKA
jgi:hypothetical protein